MDIASVEINSWIAREGERERERDRWRERGREKERQKERERARERKRETETERGTQTQPFAGDVYSNHTGHRKLGIGRQLHGSAIPFLRAAVSQWP